jgi:hypothetical protein
MATHQLAKGLASLGRHGDSMLMHVSPAEVEGLKAVGAMTGHKLHTNPHTGLPEAFDFGDFFTSLIPTGIGMLLGGPAGAKIGSTLGKTAAAAAPVIGGMAAGAAVAGAKGDDILMGTLTGGLGGYGGGNLGKTFMDMGGSKIATAGGVIPENAIAATPIDATQLSQQIGGANMTGAVAPGSAVATAPMTFTQGLGQMGQGMKTLASDPFGAGYDAFKQAGGSAFDIAAPIGMAGLAGAQDYLYPAPDMGDEEKRKAEENKYRDPRTGLLNLAQASPGLKLMATGGTVGINQSTISSGGIQDLYGTNDQTTGTQNLSKDGYGIGRLNELAAQGSRAKAADTFYAMGGPIAFARGGHQGYLDGEGDGMSDSIPATIEGKQPARLADGEFVIPADVVSHLGNGSSKAGSKKLYSMLDRVRKARIGHTKQGKQIKPEKYMPA